MTEESSAVARAMTPVDAPLNPVDTERTIRIVSNEIAHGVRVVSRTLAQFREADRLFDLAFASAYMNHDGPQTEKRQAATIATDDLRFKRDLAEVAHRHAEKQMKALEKELSAWQTISKSVTQMYSGAGSSGYGQ